MATTANSLPRSTEHNLNKGIGPDYQDAMPRFEHSLATRAVNRRRNYRTGARSLPAFLQQRWGAPDLGALSREQVQESGGFLIDERGYAPATGHGQAIGATGVAGAKRGCAT